MKLINKEVRDAIKKSQRFISRLFAIISMAESVEASYSNKKRSYIVTIEIPESSLEESNVDMVKFLQG